MLESRVTLTETGQRRVLVRGPSSWHEQRAKPDITWRVLSVALAGLALISGALLLVQVALIPHDAPRSSHVARSVQKVTPPSMESAVQMADDQGSTGSLLSGPMSVAGFDYTESVSTQTKASSAAKPKPQLAEVSAPLQDATIPDKSEAQPAEAFDTPQYTAEQDEREKQEARPFAPLRDAASRNKSKQQEVAAFDQRNDLVKPDDGEAVITDHTQPDPNSDHRSSSLAPNPAQPAITNGVALSYEKQDAETLSKRTPPLPVRKDYAYAKQIHDIPEDDSASPSSERSRVQPMALAPPDAMTTRRVSLSAYNDRVFRALARHKPKVGRRGSTKVAFGIGDGGQLSFVRVVGSSGDGNLDHLAVATIRNSAPFPRPPAGRATYTIRIYFR